MSLSRPPSHDARSRAAERWLKTFGRAGRTGSLLTILSAAAGGIALIAQCWLIARLIADVAIGHMSAGRVMHWLWPLLGVIVLRAGLEALRQGFAAETAAAIKTRLRQDLTERIAALGPVWMEGRETGAIAATLSEGVEAVEAYFASYLPQKMIAAFIPVAILVAVFPADWVSGLILTITLPIVPLFMIVVGKGAEAMSQRQWRRLSLLGAHVFDAIAGLTTLRQFGAAAREARTVARLSEDYRRATMSVLRVAFLSSAVLEFFATISVAMVAVYIGFRLYYGDLAFLPGLFALLLAPEFYRPLRDMGAHYHARMDAIGAAEGLMTILTAEVPERPAAAAAVPGLAESIRFEAVTLRYPGGTGVSGISLDLRPGQTLALVGPSGAGKTTIAKLLLGLVSPAQGRILVDGTDLAQIDADRWRAALGWVPQRATLFAGTIADNIRLARPDAGPEEVRQAARIAQADDFIAARPEGYDSPVGDGGRGLSGGQIQRIAIARMVLARPRLLILDEPTAALDLATGRAVIAALRLACPDAMVLLITHDTDLACAADRIAFIEGGRILETGTPAQMIAAGGAFADVYRLTGRAADV